MHVLSYTLCFIEFIAYVNPFYFLKKCHDSCTLLNLVGFGYIDPYTDPAFQVNTDPDPATGF